MSLASGRPNRWGRFARRSLEFAFVTAAISCGQNDSVPRAEGSTEIAPGVEVHRRRAPAAADDSPSPLVTLVHVDPSRYELVLLTAAEHGGPRPAPRWLRDFDLSAVINASMYMPNLRSTGYMRDGGRVNNAALNPRFGGMLAFGATEEGADPLRMVGTECGDFDLEALQRDYRVIVQNYRLLDCEGGAIEWEDRKLYSSAAVGLDDRGWLVLVHTGSPCRMSDLARWLAREDWGLRAAHFVEGGSDASLVLEMGGARIREVGAYEGSLGGGSFRPIPNVLGLRPR